MSEEELEREVLAILERFISPMNARAMLRRAVEPLRKRGRTLDARNLTPVFARLRQGISLFVDPGQRDSLMELLGTIEGRSAVSVEQEVINVISPSDIGLARLAARRMLEELGAGSFAVQRVATVVSELARNIVNYTPGGRIELVPPVPGRSGLIVRAIDRGAGIDNLELILAGRYRSKTGLGLGIRGVKRVMDRVDIDSGPGGTRIEAEIKL